MELKAMFPNLNVLWTRWSAYQIKPHQWGGEYLTPAKECREGGRGHGRPQCTPVLPPVEQLGIW